MSQLPQTAQQTDPSNDQLIRLEADLSTPVVSTCTVFASGGSMSASITNPDLAIAKRNRSVSFSMPTSSLSFHSPLRGRAHTSEAGSPTLEQVLLMSSSKSNASDMGYNSLSFPSSASKSDLYSSNSFLTSTSSPGKEFSQAQGSPLKARPTLSDMVGIDLAVAQAVQNLQQLQQQQAQLYSGLGMDAVPSQITTPIFPEPQTQDDAGVNILNSILSSVNHQPPAQGSGCKNTDVLLPTAEPSPYPQYSSSFGSSTDPLALERAARLYRSAASVCEATCTWSGQLPPRSSMAGPNSSYSTKIFLGGVPWDISEQTL